jgi:hypothetical protein
MARGTGNLYEGCKERVLRRVGLTMKSVPLLVLLLVSGVSLASSPLPCLVEVVPGSHLCGRVYYEHEGLLHPPLLGGTGVPYYWEGDVYLAAGTYGIGTAEGQPTSVRWSVNEGPWIGCGNPPALIFKDGFEFGLGNWSNTQGGV